MLLESVGHFGYFRAYYLLVLIQVNTSIRTLMVRYAVLDNIFWTMTSVWFVCVHVVHLVQLEIPARC